MTSTLTSPTRKVHTSISAEDMQNYSARWTPDSAVLTGHSLMSSVGSGKHMGPDSGEWTSLLRGDKVLWTVSCRQRRAM